MSVRHRPAQVLFIVVVSGFAWALLESSLPGDTVSSGVQTREETSPIFTPAHRTILEAFREFFGRRALPVQPLAFTHKVHLANNMQCTDCHTGVDQGPEARIPGVTLCMTCHQVIATDKPEIKKLAAYQARGEDIPWRRVYGFYPSAHVKFNHAPHVRAGVGCAKCHGDMTQQTVAVRAVDHTMGFCLQCHRAAKASTDCITCHY